jgi:hypothetical protein
VTEESPPPIPPPAGWYADPADALALRYWDGRQWTGYTNHPPRVPPKPLTALGRWTVAALAGMIGYALVVVVISADQLIGIDEHGDLFPLSDLGTSSAAIQLLSFLVYAAAVSTFIVWFHRAYTNLGRLGWRARFSTGWAVGVWFIPFYFLWRGKQLVNDIWLADKPEGSRVVAYVQLWWALWVLGTVLFIAPLIALFVGDLDVTSSGDVLLSTSTAEIWLGTTIAVNALMIPALALAMRFVRDVSRRDDAAIADAG